MNDNYNGYDTYQRRASGRAIPLIVLQPISPVLGWGSPGLRSGAHSLPVTVVDKKYVTIHHHRRALTVTKALSLTV